MNLAELGCGFFLGNYEACDPKKFKKIIHIHHESQPGHCVHPRRASDYYIDWKEHKPLDPAVIEQVYDFCNDPKTDILIHCAAGLGRSPHIAMIAFLAMGFPLPEAMDVITEQMFDQYQPAPQIPNWDRKVLLQIHRHLTAKGLIN